MTDAAAEAPDAGAHPVVSSGKGVKRCRNCGAAAPLAYCPACGQETALALPTARQFLKDAAGRYVALDGRTWRTLAALLFRPGFLTREYFAGRRRRYVRPARLFLVLSLAMFLAIRVVVGVPELSEDVIRIESGAGQAPEAGGGGRAAGVASAETARAGGGGTDSAGQSDRVMLPGLALTFDEQGNIRVDGAGPVAQTLRQRMERFNALPRQERFEQLVLGTLRYGPYAMFVLLPAFALLLMIVYAGRRVRHPHRPRRYAEHLVFAAHDHAFLFLAVTLGVLLPWEPLRVALLCWSPVYGLWSLRAVYGGSWPGLFARAWLLATAYLVLFAFATAGLVIAAIVIR